MTKLLEEIQKLDLEEQKMLLQDLRLSIRREERKLRKSAESTTLHEIIREIDRKRVKMYSMEEAEKLLNRID